MGVVAFLRFQVLPRENRIWLGHLEIDPDYQRVGIGRQIAWALERAARVQGSVCIRLFSRYKAIGFWQRQGYEAESDPRYFRKTLSQQPLAG